MRKKFTIMLAMSIFLGSSFSSFATEVKDTDKIFFEEVEEDDENEIKDEVKEEEINQVDKIDEIEEIKEEDLYDEVLDQPGEKQMILQLDSTLAWIDGLEYTLTARPLVIEGTTYLPLRFMADMLLEADVDWNELERRVTIDKDGKIVQVTIDNQEAYVDGNQVQIQKPPIIADSLTYLPLRSIADLFSIQTNYDEATRQITLTYGQEDTYEPPVIVPPIAQFSFTQNEYIAGQNVKTVDESFHEGGLGITKTLWMINFDESKTNQKLENMFSKPREGSYLVSLKVEAGKDNWSEWTTKEITVAPNKKPVVTTLLPTKNVYAGGEPIDFTYTYENEDWEDIKATRWTYRKVGEVVSKSVVEKPKHIFQAGDYVITLQLQDDYGNWSDTKEVIVSIGAQSVQTELQYRFTKGEPGDIIDNFGNFNYLSYKTVVPDQTIFIDGTLFMSNSPENVKENGILYRDTVEGAGRILLHHHNSFTEEENMAEPKKVVLIAENTSNEMVYFNVSNKVVKGPSTDILFVGQQLLYDYFNGSEVETHILSPGEKMYLYDSGAKRWDRGQVTSTQMDFNVIGELTLTSAAVGRDAKIDDIKSLPQLAKDVHPRGTFEKTDILHKITPERDQPTRLVLGAGAQEWINGYDALTAEMVQNRGNFGVNYEVEITATEDTGILLNPRADLFRGALKWDDEDEAFLAPSRGYFMGHNSKGVMLGVVKAGETRTLRYSLPSGSGSPVLLVFMPKSHWNR